jgi:5-(carboxyamino)imidazole ribonucleotide synthase
MTKRNIGILGGGQLGMFICQAAKKMGINTIVLSKNKNFSARKFCDNFIIGEYEDKVVLNEFINSANYFTIETENVPKQILKVIEKKKKIFPSSKIIEITQNRLKEKKFLNSIKNIKTARYKQINNFDDLQNAIELFNFNAILKSCELGYDGKGQFLINKKNFLDFKNRPLKNYILEEFLEFEKEISIIISRSKKNLIYYPPVENLHKNSILRETRFPANISENTTKNAIKIGVKIAEEMNLIGILAIEMFVINGSDLTINELAPRPHNSGHWSMDCCKYSQYQNLLFSIFNSKVKEPIPKKKCKMVNLIGNDYKKINSLRNQYKCYDYFKKELNPNRKMGHYMIIGDET